MTGGPFGVRPTLRWREWIRTFSSGASGGRDCSGGGFPNAGYEPHPSCGDCLLTARSRPKSSRNRWFADALLERTGFEPSVPVRQAKLTRSCRVVMDGSKRHGDPEGRVRRP